MIIRRIGWVVLAAAIGLTAESAWAVFAPPAESRLREAADDPTKLRELLRDASVNQAADVTRSVLVRIVKLDLKPKERNARLISLMKTLIQAMPGHGNALAVILGRAVAANPTASLAPDLISAIQSALVVASGNDGAGAGASFGNAYQLAMLTVAGAPGGGKNVPPTPPPPPVALPYEGQDLR